MVQRYKCVVFDVDGTLLDTSEGILSAVGYTIEQFGLEPLDENTIKSFIGPPIQNSFKRVFGFDDKKTKQMAEVFRERYKEADLLKATPYDGIYDVFESLKANGIKPAIATYKRQDYAQTLLKHFHFDAYTDILYGSDFDGKLKKQDIIGLALKASGITDFSEAVMVGDSDNDAAGAERIGIDFVGVTYGFGFRSREDVFEFRAIGAADTTVELQKLIV